MQFIDTHTHLYSEEFDADQDQAIKNAIQVGVSHFFIPAIDSSCTETMYALEQKFPNHIFLMMGLHPTYVKENYLDELAHVENQLKQRKFYAIGEIGIDLYWDKTFLEAQKIAFKRQIQLAKKYKLPIVIHCRTAFDEIFEVLETEKGADLFGIFHCFSGNHEQALQAISYNMKLGIGGVVTFKNGQIDQFLDKIDLKHLVLETDSPYLAPVPHRGKRNESAYLPLIANKLTTIYNLPLETIAEITSQNAKQVFGLV
jgi:TatD DNase family protein